MHAILVQAIIVQAILVQAIISNRLSILSKKLIFSSNKLGILSKKLNEYERSLISLMLLGYDKNQTKCVAYG